MRKCRRIFHLSRLTHSTLTHRWERTSRRHGSNHLQRSISSPRDFPYPKSIPGASPRPQGPFSVLGPGGRDCRNLLSSKTRVVGRASNRSLSTAHLRRQRLTILSRLLWVSVLTVLSVETSIRSSGRQPMTSMMADYEWPSRRNCTSRELDYSQNH